MNKTETTNYDAYRASGVEWLGEIPGHWELRKGKWIFNKEERPVRKDDDIITCFRDGQVTLRVNRKTEGFTNALKEYGYQGIRKGDLVIHNMDAFAGAIGVSDSDGKSTPVYSVCTPRFKDIANPYYYAYFLRNLAKNGFIESLAKGIRERSTDFRFNDFGLLELPLPSFSEQTAIAQFLDTKTALIDKAIVLKEKQIALLKERRQAIIHQAVNKGLNPDVPMKDSGIDWIGKIPVHWKIQAVKYSLNGVVDCEHKTAPFVDDRTYFVVRTSNVKDGILIHDDAKYTSEKGYQQWTRRGVPRAGDILLTREAPAGEACIVPSNINICLGQRMVWLKVDKTKLNPQFLIYLIYSSLIRNYIDFLSAGSTVLHLNISDIKNIPIISMPLDEQERIVGYLNKITSNTNAIIANENSQLEKLKEYKASLINSAVTGKIKVT